jgi:hypothetical protein
MMRVYRQEPDKDILLLADVYLRYVKLMQKEDGSFHNDYTYDRRFPEGESEDAFGRTVWAMGYMIDLGINDAYTQFAMNVFSRAAVHFGKIGSLRGRANTMIGLCYFLKRYPDNESMMHVLHSLTQSLIVEYGAHADGEWNWFEPTLSYDNAILPLCLLYAYERTRDEETLRIAVKAMHFLGKQTIVGDRLSLIGNRAWHQKGRAREKGGQQPIDAMEMVLLYEKAFSLTGEIAHYERLLLSFSWFLGNNDLRIPLYDEETKGCCDGIDESGINRNQGAESSLCYHLSYLSLESACGGIKQTDGEDQIVLNELKGAFKMMALSRWPATAI